MKFSVHCQTTQFHRRPVGVVLAAVFVLLCFEGLAWGQDDIVLQSGDEVVIVIPERGHAAEIIEVIDENGEVSLGFYGRAYLAGMTLVEARDELRDVLGTYFRSTAGVAISLERRQNLIIVNGQVTTPGPLFLPISRDLWMAVQQVGLLPGANLSDVRLIRDGEETVIDLRAFLTRESSAPLPILESNDTIFVPALPGWSSVATAETAFGGEGMRNSQVLILGAVGVQGYFERAPGITVLEALAQAGGPSLVADLSNVRLITEDDNQRLDLTAVLLGEVPEDYDLPQTGPVLLYVPEQFPETLNPFSDSINIIGGVAGPGVFDVREPVLLMDALSLAGGPEGIADIDEIYHVRRGDGFSLAQEYDLEEYFEEGGELGSVMVYPGDTVYVPIEEESVWEETMMVIGNVAVIASTVALIWTLSDRAGEE